MQQKTARGMTPGERRYHHGNLREALIKGSLTLIEQKGVRALTLREIGTQVGVSRMAAYRHFADKDDLLQAIREAGFGLFADALEQARRDAPEEFTPRLTAMALAYVRFAAEHPAYYEVMFGWRDTRHDRPAPQSARSFGILVDTIRSGQETGEVRAGDAVTLARIVWAQVHGISMLRLETDLSPDGAGTRFVKTFSEVLQGGLEANPDISH